LKGKRRDSRESFTVNEIPPQPLRAHQRQSPGAIVAPAESTPISKFADFGEFATASSSWQSNAVRMAYYHLGLGPVRRSRRSLGEEPTRWQRKSAFSGRCRNIVRASLPRNLVFCVSIFSRDQHVSSSFGAGPGIPILRQKLEVSTVAARPEWNSQRGFTLTL